MENIQPIKKMSYVRACPINGRPKSEKEANDRKLHSLERKVDELSSTINILNERITTLEREKTNFFSTQSFLIDNPFLFTSE